MNFITSFDYDLTARFHRTYILNEMKQLLEFHNSCWLSRHAINDDAYEFYCKNNGKQCFNIIFSSQQKYSNTFTLTFASTEHMGSNCQKKNQAKLHLQTKCLIKLRKQEIKQFVQQNNLMGMQSGDILLQYSRKWCESGDSFYKEYLEDGKLRTDVKKNWDNVLGNIVRRLKNYKCLNNAQTEDPSKNQNLLQPISLIKKRYKIKKFKKLQSIEKIKMPEQQKKLSVVPLNIQLSQNIQNFETKRAFAESSGPIIAINTNIIQEKYPKIIFFEESTSNYSRSLNNFDNCYGSYNYLDFQNTNLKQIFQNSPLVSTYKLPLIN